MYLGPMIHQSLLRTNRRSSTANRLEMVSHRKPAPHDFDPPLPKGDTFNEITSYRLPYPKCCALGDPDAAEELFLALKPMDYLHGYTVEMWGILTDVVLYEWFGLRLPPSKVPWDGPVYLPPHLRLLYCLDRSYARQACNDIQSRYLRLDHSARSRSIFAAYNVHVPDDFQREHEGLHFIARQIEHFRSRDDYLFITQAL